MEATTKLRRGGTRIGVLAVALSTAVTGIALAGVASPAHAMGGGGGGGGGGGMGMGMGGFGGDGWMWQGDARTVNNVRQDLGFDTLPYSVTGRGVGVALIDTGVAAVPGLSTGNVVNGPDLSFDSQDPARRYIDGFGHGTHLAGIISARTPELRGLAPDAKLTSIKVGSSNGAVDVSQVIAGIDWAVAHRGDDPNNPIRVLVLAYGTDGVQSYQVDPLCAAVENAWRAGITVVVAGGNRGGKTKLLNPATDPFVLAVGAMDDNATASRYDDKVADFSSVGQASRAIDVVAPGKSIVSLRAPGSAIDVGYPLARQGNDFFRGSGSSQAAAVAGAVAADMLQQFPGLAPDQLKKLMQNSALVLGDPASRIFGLDIGNAYRTYTNRYNTLSFSVSASAQNFSRSSGTGSLEGARGSAHLTDGNVTLSGEKDIFGSFSTSKWAPASANQTAWKGGAWMGRDWTGNGWTTASSGIKSWTGRYWSGQSWSGRYWSSASWTSISWQGGDWG